MSFYEPDELVLFTLKNLTNFLFRGHQICLSDSSQFGLKFLDVKFKTTKRIFILRLQSVRLIYKFIQVVLS